MFWAINLLNSSGQASLVIPAIKLPKQLECKKEQNDLCVGIARGMGKTLAPYVFKFSPTAFYDIMRRF